MSLHRSRYRRSEFVYRGRGEGVGGNAPEARWESEFSVCIFLKGCDFFFLSLLYFVYFDSFVCFVCSFLLFYLLVYLYLFMFISVLLLFLRFF